MKRGTTIADADSRPDPSGFRERLEIKNTIEEIGSAEQRLLTALRGLGYEESAVFAVRLAFQEATHNARVHGNAEDPTKSIFAEFDIDKRRAVIEVEDQGGGFDPETVPDPTREENLHIPAGRGLTIIRGFMSNVEIVKPGNRIRMTYERPGRDRDPTVS